MKKLLALLIAITSLALVGPVLAQTAPGDSGVKEPAGGARPSLGRRGTRSAAQGSMMLIRAYNPQTVTTVKGTVESLDTFPPNLRWRELSAVPS